METNIYDLLIAIVPSLIVGIISLITIVYSNKKLKNDQDINLRISKIESLYSKFNKINGSILAEKNNYNSDENYFTSRQTVSRIIEEIELLKVEAQLYLGINSIDSFRWSTERLLNQMVQKDIKDSYKDNLHDGEYEEDDEEHGRINTIVPSTFENYFDEYSEKYDDIEDRILSIAREQIGIRIKKVQKRKDIKLAKRKS